jgi:hypothetical protein
MFKGVLFCIFMISGCLQTAMKTNKTKNLETKEADPKTQNHDQSMALTEIINEE